MCNRLWHITHTNTSQSHFTPKQGNKHSRKQRSFFSLMRSHLVRIGQRWFSKAKRPLLLKDDDFCLVSKIWQKSVRVSICGLTFQFLIFFLFPQSDDDALDSFPVNNRISYQEYFIRSENLFARLFITCSIMVVDTGWFEVRMALANEGAALFLHRGVEWRTPIRGNYGFLTWSKLR